MARRETIEVEGSVLDARANRTFTVKLPNGHVVTAHLAGEASAASFQLLRGDKVMLEMTPYDLSKGRIISRHK